MDNQLAKKYTLFQQPQDLENGRAYKKAILNGGKLKIYRFIYLGPTNDDISGTMFNYVPIKQKKVPIKQEIKETKEREVNKTCPYKDLFNNAVIYKGFIEDEELKEMLTFVNQEN